MTDIEKVARAMCRADPEVRMGDADGVVEQRVNIEWVHYVDQAKVAIAAIQPAPQWQGVESAPPPPNTRVLLAWRDWRDGKWLIEAAPYETGERVGPYSNVSRHGAATHWMPLPTPPAGGSDAE